MARRDDEAIVDATGEVLAEHGLSGLTLERIAAAAGVSRMTLHRRALTREGLLRELRRRMEEEHREALWPALASPGTGRERLERALAADCEVAERHLALLGALQEPAHAALFHDEPGPGGVPTRPAFVEPLERLLRDGVLDGSLAPPGDPAELATVLVNLVGPTYRHLRTGHAWTPERARQGVIAIVLEGVVAR